MYYTYESQGGKGYELSATPAFSLVANQLSPGRILRISVAILTRAGPFLLRTSLVRQILLACR